MRAGTDSPTLQAVFAVLLSGNGGGGSGVTLVDIGQFAGDLLNLFGQRRNLIAVTPGQPE